MAKLSPTSARAMNQLMASEMSRAGMKQASEEIQAFKDHQEYLDVLSSALKEDKTESWAPNEPTKD